MTQDEAATIQAIGSVIGIFVAAIVPAWQHHKAKQKTDAENRLRSFAIAYGAERELKMILISLISLDSFIEQIEGHGGEDGVQIPFTWLSFEDPHTLINSRSDLYVLGGETVAPLFRLLSTLSSYKYWLEERGEMAENVKVCRMRVRDIPELRRYSDQVSDEVQRAGPGITKLLASQEWEAKAGRFEPGMIGWELWGGRGR